MYMNLCSPEVSGLLLSTRTTGCDACSIPGWGGIFDRCMGSVPTQHREKLLRMLTFSDNCGLENLLDLLITRHLYTGWISYRSTVTLDRTSRNYTSLSQTSLATGCGELAGEQLPAAPAQTL